MTVDEFMNSIKRTIFNIYDCKGKKYSIRLKDLNNENAITFMDENYSEICSYNSFADMKLSENYKDISNREFLEIDEINVQKDYDAWSRVFDTSYIKIIIK